MAKRNIDLKHLDIRDKNSNPIENVSDLLKAQLEATCDCGIDCCKGELVLKDKGTNQPVRISVTDGELSVGQSEIGGASYKVYTALLSQSGTNAPTAVILENTLGGTVVWTRSSVGTYSATLTNAFPSNKTVIIYDGVRPLVSDLTNAGYYHIERSNNSTVSLNTGYFETNSDGYLDLYPIEIRVYP